MLTNSHAETSHVKDTLAKLSQLWGQRATVNSGLVDHTTLAFQPAAPDFSEALLPFRDHPRWKDAPAELKLAALSYGWAVYNMKTVYVECDIVTPACEDLIKHPVGDQRARFELQQAMSEALLDEALHTKMSVTACNYIYMHRSLKPLEIRQFNLVGWRDRLLGTCNSEWQRRLARFAIATASETLITDYLKNLASSDDIQPICREVTRAHALDEWGHSSVFSVAAEHVVATLTQDERQWFANIVPKTVEMFADNELDVWAQAFEILAFPHREEIINDSRGVNEVTVYRDSVFNLLGKLSLTPECV